MRTLKILGFFLTYPEESHIAAAAECASVLKAENHLSAAALDGLADMFKNFAATNLLDLQENYVALFDRTPSLSLHLFEHIYGDSRSRGQALADLLRIYEQARLYINQAEMPDFLPLFAEYAASLPPLARAENIGNIVDILALLAERLRGRKSFYAAIAEAMIELADRRPNLQSLRAQLKENSGAALGFKQIDREWEEQFAFNGQAAGSCPQRQARRPNPKKEERL